ncbi:hypothetical protein PORY_001506 [Pneumocystis oryctolagi]|uniref:Uncharacterized protein n=1 Tax=Pneumocystis oryctolagi TaxID=42067 RepID=A0ACB7CCS0_9ASCO|nr:hypothetical protein PORY_001506 [Pneumocystis oryctolagi]
MTLKLSKNTLCFEKYEDKISTASILVKNPSLKHKVAFNFQTNPTSDYYTVCPSIAILDPDSECQVSFERYPRNGFFVDEEICSTEDMFVIQSIQINNKMNKKMDKMEKNNEIFWNYLKNEIEKNYKKTKIKETILSIHINNEFSINKFNKHMIRKLAATKKDANDATIEINHFSTMPTALSKNTMFVKNHSEYIHQKKTFLNSSETFRTIISVSRKYNTQKEGIKYHESFKNGYDIVNRYENSLQSLQNTFLCSTETVNTQISNSTAITVVDLRHSHKTCNQEINDDSSEFWSNDDLTNNEIDLESLETNFNIIEPKNCEKDFNKGIEHLHVWKLIRERNQGKIIDNLMTKKEISEDLVIPSIILEQPLLNSTTPINSSPSLLSLSHKSAESSLSQSINCTYIHPFSTREFSDSVGRTLFGEDSLIDKSYEPNINILSTPTWLQSILNLQNDFQTMIDDFDQKMNFHIEDFDFMNYNSLQTNITETSQILA